VTDLNETVQQALKVAGDPAMTDAYKQALRSAGIKEDEVPQAPDPGPILETIGLEQLFTEPPRNKGVVKETLPMRLIGKPYTQPGGGKFPGYVSFILIPVWHPTHGAKLVTTSYERTDGSFTPIGEWVMSLSKGDVFAVGEIATGKGFTTYRPVTVG
jgi:hypothetical protein